MEHEDNELYYSMEIKGAFISISHEEYMKQPNWFKNTFRAYGRLLKAEKYLKENVTAEEWKYWKNEHRLAKNNFNKLSNTFIKNHYNALSILEILKGKPVESTGTN